MTKDVIGQIIDALVERFGSLEAATPYLVAYVAQHNAAREVTA